MTEELEEVIKQLELEEEKREKEKAKTRVKKPMKVSIPKVETIEVPVILTEFLRRKFRKILSEFFRISKKIDYPEYVWKEWCKHKPADKYYYAWLRIWANAVLAHASQKKKFVLILSEITKEPPFASNGTKIEDKYIVEAVDLLVGEGKAKWLDDKKVLLVWWIDKKEIAKKIWETVSELHLPILLINDLTGAGIPEEAIPEILDELSKFTRIKVIMRENKLIGIKFIEIP